MNEDPYAEARKRMVEMQLRRRGINDPRVLEAMERIPREQFMAPGSEAEAYDDKAAAIQSGQTISQPYIVALMTQLLEPQPTDRVLEVGTGSGYQAAILALLCEHLYTVERHRELSDIARRRLEALGLTNVSYEIGDGTLGLADEAPFGGILVTAAAPRIPRTMTDQLDEGGRLVIPVGDAAYQTLTVVRRQRGTLVETPSISCRFVPLIGQAGWNAKDVAGQF